MRKSQRSWHGTGGQCKLFGATSGQSCAQREEAHEDQDSEHDESDRKYYGQQDLDPSMIRVHRSFLSAAFRQSCSFHQGFAIFSSKLQGFNSGGAPTWSSSFTRRSSSAPVILFSHGYRGAKLTFSSLAWLLVAQGDGRFRIPASGGMTEVSCDD